MDEKRLNIIPKGKSCEISFRSAWNFCTLGKNLDMWLSWFDFLATILGLTQVQVHYGFQQNPSKTIDPSGKPKGNVVHMVHCAVSLKIVLMGGYNAQVLAA
jgi:hypothetical protein